MEATIDKTIADISSKIKKMVVRTKRLEAENDALRKSVFEYLQQIENQKNIVESLQQASYAQHIVEGSTYDKKKLQKEVDKYISLLDKCIASLHVQ